MSKNETRLWIAGVILLVLFTGLFVISGVVRAPALGASMLGILLTNTVVGYQLGKLKNIPGWGLIAGLFLGWVGWLIITVTHRDKTA